MASLNKVMIIGNAGKDAELRYMANGTAQAKFSVATSTNKKVGDGWEKETEWHNVVLWGDMAERMAQYIVKGTQVYVEGRIQTRSWDDDKGQKHYMTEVIGNTCQALGKRESGRETSGDGARDAWQREGLDDLPFE